MISGYVMYTVIEIGLLNRKKFQATLNASSCIKSLLRSIIYGTLRTNKKIFHKYGIYLFKKKRRRKVCIVHSCWTRRIGNSKWVKYVLYIRIYIDNEIYFYLFYVDNYIFSKILPSNVRTYEGNSNVWVFKGIKFLGIIVSTTL